MSARSHVTILLLLLLIGGTTGLRAQVTADFTATGTSGCSPIIVSFSDQSSGNIISRQWIFGNGNNAQGNLTSVTAAYTTPGTYDVKLIVSDGTNTDSITKTA
ncbi:MAG: PKD domain-containing protein, partial [Bacteroidota bacterium]